MKLRDYQERVNEQTKSFFRSTLERGQILSPVGSGKTVCFTVAIEEARKIGAKNIVVVHPQLLLSEQQQERLQKDFTDDVQFASLHSGKRYNKRSHQQIASLHPEDIEKSINNSSKMHVTLTTYKSIHKLRTINTDFDLMVCDEAHNIMKARGDERKRILSGMVADKTLFYTATPRVERDGDNQMPEEIFGKIIEAVKPREMIEKGYLVAPLLHLMEVESPKDEVDVVDLISRAFVEQRDENKAWGLPYHQMLVATRGIQRDNNQVDRRYREIQSYVREHCNEEVDVWTVSAAYVRKNGRIQSGSRIEALAKLAESERSAVVCHYNTLSEGLDIDTLSGALIIRSMDGSTLVQTIGRPARPLKGDCDEFRNPKKELFDPEAGLDIRTKRRCIVTIPVIDDQPLSGDDWYRYIKGFITGGYEDLGTYFPEGTELPWGKNLKEVSLRKKSDLQEGEVADYKIIKLFEDLDTLLETN